MPHTFLLQQGIWLGEGRVTFTASPETLHFATKWEIKEGVNNEIWATQQVEMRGINDRVVNRFRLFDLTQTHFAIELQNELIGSVIGKGLYDQVQIGWEFLQHSDFQGFEVYREIHETEYSLHAEFCSSEDYRTIVHGRIWKKSEDLQLD